MSSLEKSFHDLSSWWQWVKTTFDPPTLPADRLEVTPDDEIEHETSKTRLRDRRWWIRFLMIALAAVVTKLSGIVSPNTQLVGPDAKTGTSFIVAAFLFAYVSFLYICYFFMACYIWYTWQEETSRIWLKRYFTMSFCAPFILLFVPFFKIHSQAKISTDVYEIFLTAGELVFSVMFISLRTMAQSCNQHYTMYGNPRVLLLRDISSKSYFVLLTLLFVLFMQFSTLLNSIYGYDMAEYYVSIPLYFIMLTKKHFDDYYANIRTVQPMWYTYIFNGYIIGVWAYYVVKAQLVLDLFAWITQNYVTFVYLTDYLCERYPPGDMKKRESLELEAIRTGVEQIDVTISTSNLDKGSAKVGFEELSPLAATPAADSTGKHNF